MAPIEDQPIVFYIDRCLGGKIISEILQNAGVKVETHDRHFAQNAKDVDWLPQVGNKGWVVLTKDANISKNHLERIAVANANIKMFILASQNLSGQDMAAIFLKNFVKMQEFVRNYDAPFIAKIYKNGDIELWKSAESLLEESSKLSADGDEDL